MNPLHHHDKLQTDIYESLHVIRMPPFHLAFPVHDLEAARRFYSDLLGCPTGRESDQWIDFNLYGHQIVAHVAPRSEKSSTHHVDGEDVPVPHFGLILEWGDWEKLARKLEDAECRFLIKPGIRFKGQAGEQATMFVSDPSGNALEFKAFRSSEDIFAREKP
ncbi:Glyoxalase/bleomycin resistance protein/dioxygenase [mine drainage metagenome]|uniref:Glyoxalase/bleomycin resistance protein/dioxygenase n=2 Tax=mine drainage metagenome TaxID=410659 RepID=T1D1U4_9ZZZZ